MDRNVPGLKQEGSESALWTEMSETLIQALALNIDESGRLANWTNSCPRCIKHFVAGNPIMRL